MEQQQQQQIYEDNPPTLGYLLGAIAGTSIIVIFDIAVLKWMWQKEIDHSLGIPPS